VSRIIAPLLVLLFALPAPLLADRSLRGSPESMQEQNRVAREHRLDFYRTPSDIVVAVMRGELVRFTGNADYAVADFVRFPYARAELLVFIERLAAQYRDACGQKLVVTSLTRPSSQQPANAHRLSVHPAGMAVDLRVSDRPACVTWLSSALLGLDRRGVLNATREHRPPHFHVAVYPTQYMSYARERIAAEEAAAEAGGITAVVDAAAAEEVEAALAESGAATLAGEVAVTRANAAPSRRGGWLALFALGPLPLLWVAALRRRRAARANAAPAAARPDRNRV
jgi:hypothetical protein